MRLLECPIFPVVLVLVTDENEFYKLTKGVERSCAFPPGGAASTISYSGHQEGCIILVALGDTSDSSREEVHSILTHEAVHVKQFVFEVIGEEHPGVETEAYVVQYFANYLIQEYNYRVEKKAKQLEKQKEKEAQNVQ